MRELYLARAPYRLLNAPIVRHIDGSPASSLRLRVVLEELVSRGNAYTMMSHGVPGPGRPAGPARGVKPVTKLVVRARIWSTTPKYFMFVGHRHQVK